MVFTAVFQEFGEGFVGFVEELPGANTQGSTLEEARANLVEAVELILREGSKHFAKILKFPAYIIFLSSCIALSSRAVSHISFNILSL